MSSENLAQERACVCASFSSRVLTLTKALMGAPSKEIHTIHRGTRLRRFPQKDSWGAVSERSRRALLVLGASCFGVAAVWPLAQPSGFDRPVNHKLKVPAALPPR